MVSQPNIGVIDRWTLPWPEIRIPPYRIGHVGAWELKRQVQPVLRRSPRTCWRSTSTLPRGVPTVTDSERFRTALPRAI